MPKTSSLVRIFVVIAASTLYASSCSGHKTHRPSHSSSAIAAVSWTEKAIYVHQSAVAKAAEALGVTNSAAGQWVLARKEREPERVTVLLVPEKIDLPPFEPQAGDIRVARGRRCSGSRAAYRSPCLKAVSGYMRMERAGYFSCELASPEEVCEESYVKIADTILYDDVECKKERLRRPLMEWVCFPKQKDLK